MRKRRTDGNDETARRAAADGKRLTEDGKRGAHMTAVDANRDRPRRAERGRTAVRSTARARALVYVLRLRAAVCKSVSRPASGRKPAASCSGTGKGGGGDTRCLPVRHAGVG